MELLQTYFKKDNPQDMITILIIICIGIIAIIIYNIVSKTIKGTPTKTKNGIKPKAINQRGFSRAAKSYGFTKEASSLLQYYAKKFNLSDPDFVFKNPKALDSFLKKVYVESEKSSESDATSEKTQTILFSIRETIDNTQSKLRPIHSTREIHDGTPFSFIGPEDESHASKIYLVEPNELICDTIKDSTDTEIRFKRGTKLQCFFYAQGQQGYSFQTRVAGYETRGNRVLMKLSHSDKVSMLPHRTHIRRELLAVCSFVRAKIVIVHVNGENKRKAVYDTQSIPGTLCDVSAGGLSIKTANPFTENEYLRIDFTIPGKPIQEAVGKVVKTNRLQSVGGVMHIQFVKITRKALNIILSYVYRYDE